MRAGLSHPGAIRGALRTELAVRSDSKDLRTFAIAAGLCWSILFVAIGLRYELQMYADGSMFSYSVAVQDPWAFHWHNISGRLFVYLYSFVPAEIYVGLTGNAHGGVVLYGFLFFVAQLIGLLATFAADRSDGRIIFSYACVSTACLCPLVFGFPTEMWVAHALFWPTLALCHYAHRGIGTFALICAALLALVLTHGAAPILAFAILATLGLRGLRDAAFLRAVWALLAVIPIWVGLHVIFPPDDYFASALMRAALHFFDVGILTCGVMRLLFGALAGYGAVLLLVRRWSPSAHVYAAALIAVALAVYWLWFDQGLHADNRYYLRTVMVIAIPVLGAVAAAYALQADGRQLPFFLPGLMAALTRGAAVRAAAGAIFVVMLVHAVETAKFITAWALYETALRALAMGAVSDPVLGDPRFVSSHRIAAGLNRLSWFSTTPFLSVLVAPHFAPARLVVDPESSYFWLSCETATENLAAPRVVPAESRRLVRVYSCLHR